MKLKTLNEYNRVIKHKKTQAQEDKLMQMALSDTFKSVISRPSLVNKNLLVKATDEKGRVTFYELTPDGEKIHTTLWF